MGMVVGIQRSLGWRVILFFVGFPNAGLVAVRQWGRFVRAKMAPF